MQNETPNKQQTWKKKNKFKKLWGKVSAGCCIGSNHLASYMKCSAWSALKIHVLILRVCSTPAVDYNTSCWIPLGTSSIHAHQQHSKATIQSVCLQNVYPGTGAWVTIHTLEGCGLVISGQVMLDTNGGSTFDSRWASWA